MGDDAQRMAEEFFGNVNRVLEGGAGLLRAASKSPVPVVAMIRPRGGDFCFNEAETELMLQEIDAVASAGLQGVAKIEAGERSLAASAAARRQRRPGGGTGRGSGRRARLCG